MQKQFSNSLYCIHRLTCTHRLDLFNTQAHYRKLLPFQLQQIQLPSPQQGLLLPDLTTKEKSDVEVEQGQQFFWVQERTDDHVLLMSVPAEARERNRVDVETVIETVQPQVILERYQSRDAEKGSD
ncbi:hypothetical protein QQF64_033979 [Cirrhinus molitorella]|uniref:Uncharacterized protein n=1 Tax=Cirrhinus molitorella TaxID=172907 RepID=A0ABR3MVD5_9TELE